MHDVAECPASTKLGDYLDGRIRDMSRKIYERRYAVGGSARKIVWKYMGYRLGPGKDQMGQRGKGGNGIYWNVVCNGSKLMFQTYD